MGLVDCWWCEFGVNSVADIDEVLDMFGVVLVYLDFYFGVLYGLVGLLGLGICLRR